MVVQLDQKIDASLFLLLLYLQPSMALAVIVDEVRLVDLEVVDEVTQEVLLKVVHVATHVADMVMCMATID